MEQKFEIKSVPLKQLSQLQMTISQLLLVVFVIYLFIATDSNQDFWINPTLDLDVSQIAYKMWIHYFVGVSHFAECHENCLLAVREMLINILKSLILQLRGKWKSDLESVSGT